MTYQSRLYLDDKAYLTHTPQAGREVATREPDRRLGKIMFLKVIEVGDLHAGLWERLTLIGRQIDGPEDVTLGVHPDLGLCIVKHYGYADRVEWWTSEPLVLD